MLFCTILTGYASRIASERPRSAESTPLAPFPSFLLYQKLWLFRECLIGLLYQWFGGVSGVFLGRSGGVWGVFWGVPDRCPDFTQPWSSCLVILFVVVSLWVLTWRTGTSVIKVDQTEGTESMSGISSIECRAVSFARSLIPLIKPSLQSISLMGCELNSVWGGFLHPPYTNLTTQKMIEWSKSWEHGSNSYPSSNLSFFQLSFKDLKWPFTIVTKWHL